MASATASIWDHCYLDTDIASLVDELGETMKKEDNQPFSCQIKYGSSSSSIARGNNSVTAAGNDDYQQQYKEQQHKEHNIQSALSDAEQSCATALSLLDSILDLLNDVSSAHDDVTGRTNSLMTTCENLLEQQVNIIQMIYIINIYATFTYFFLLLLSNVVYLIITNNG